MRTIATQDAHTHVFVWGTDLFPPCAQHEHICTRCTSQTCTHLANTSTHDVRATRTHLCRSCVLRVYTRMFARGTLLHTMYAQREHLDTHLHTMYISEVHTRMFASGTHVCATCVDQHTSVSDTNTSAPMKNTSVCTSSEFAPRRMSRAALDECSQNEHFARCALDASQTRDSRSENTTRIPHESLRVCHRNGTSMNAHEMHLEPDLTSTTRTGYWTNVHAAGCPPR